MNWFFPLTLLLVIGCAHSPPRRVHYPPLDLSGFRKIQAEREKALAHAGGRVRLRLRNRDQSLSGSGRWAMNYPDEARLELWDPLGRTQFLATLRGKHFASSIPRDHAWYEEDSSGEKFLSHYFLRSLSFRELSGLSGGVLPKLRRERWERVDGGYRLLAEWNGRAVVIQILPSGAVQKVSLASENQLTVTYSDFDERQEAAYHVEVKQQQTELSLDWLRWDSRKEPWEPALFDAVRPTDAKLIELN